MNPNLQPNQEIAIWDINTHKFYHLHPDVDIELNAGTGHIKLEGRVKEIHQNPQTILEEKAEKINQKLQEIKNLL